MTELPNNNDSGPAAGETPGSAAEPEPLRLRIAAGLVSGFVFGMHWPFAFAPAFLAGALFSRRLARLNISPFLLWTAYAALCILFHAFPTTYPYSFIYEVNPNYFISCLALTAAAYVAARAGRPVIGLVAGFIFISAGIAAARYNQPLFFFGLVILIVADRYSQRLKELPAALIALAVFHAALGVGVASIGGSHGFPIYHKVLIEADGDAEIIDGVREQDIAHYFRVDEAIVEAIEEQRDKIGRGTPSVAVAIPGAGEIAVLMQRSDNSYVAMLEAGTLEYRRKSFPDSAGDMLTISKDGRFLASIVDGKAVLLDTEMLEWRDTLDLGLRGPAGIEAGASGTLYVSSAVEGVVYRIEYDEHGHGMKVAETLDTGPGALGLEYIEDRNLVAAGNRIDGMFYLLDSDSLDIAASIYIGPFVRMNDFHEAGGRIFFMLNQEKKRRFGYVYVDELLSRGIEPPPPAPRFHSFFVMPVNLLRSTL